jgi:hypothetical protein
MLPMQSIMYFGTKGRWTAVVEKDASSGLGSEQNEDKLSSEFYLCTLSVSGMVTLSVTV